MRRPPRELSFTALPAALELFSGCLAIQCFSIAEKNPGSASFSIFCRGFSRSRLEYSSFSRRRFDAGRKSYTQPFLAGVRFIGGNLKIPVVPMPSTAYEIREARSMFSFVHARSRTHQLANPWNFRRDPD